MEMKRRAAEQKCGKAETDNFLFVSFHQGKVRQGERKRKAAGIVFGFVLLFGLIWAQSDSLADTTPARPYRLVQDGPVRVTVRVTEKKGKGLTIGDRLKVAVTVSHPRNLTVSPPFVEKADDFTVSEQRHEIHFRGDTAFDVYNLTLVLWTVGERKLPPFLVTYQDVSGLCAAASDSLPVKVMSLIDERMQDINDIKPQVEFPNLIPLWVLLGALVLGAGGYWGYRLLRRYRQKQVALAPLLSPWEEALRALEQVPVEELLSSGQVKRYYYTVSEIVKRYLTRRFEFPAIDQTTSEILRELRQRKLPEFERFRAFFFETDRVKYAKHIPDKPQEVVVQARQLVELTMPAPESTGSNGAGARGIAPVQSGG
ncbi:MAG: DUF4381 family protein [bacterium]|jgi:hypothetical protein|nr:DUF4381 domain-containing protein [candidate division WOR-3 bacterium]MDH7519551.1 DUF4381 family protein [bacterium]